MTVIIVPALKNKVFLCGVWSFCEHCDHSRRPQKEGILKTVHFFEQLLRGIFVFNCWRALQRLTHGHTSFL